MQIEEYISLLCTLISTPSLSGHEDESAFIIEKFLSLHGCNVERIGNNVIARSFLWDQSKPVLLLNSHLDTVKPSVGYTRDPFLPVIEGDLLYGLGSNDAGASVVAMIATFLNFRESNLPFNIMLALTAEEETSGINGIRTVLDKHPRIDMAIVGEPTSLKVGIGERGLIVLDCEAIGVSGHAAREEGVNAIYNAMVDIDILRNLKLEKCSSILGPVKFTVTQINAGTQHNVVPDRCRFVVDVRTTDAYTNEQIVSIVKEKIRAEVKARSTGLRASAVDMSHPLVKASKAAGLSTFVSPTMSDMTHMPFPAIKIGPGDSARSHTSDEYVRISEIEQGVSVYKSIINSLSGIL